MSDSPFAIILMIFIFIDIASLFAGWFYINKNSYNFGPDFNKWKMILILVAVCLLILLGLLLLLVFVAT